MFLIAFGQAFDAPTSTRISTSTVSESEAVVSIAMLDYPDTVSAVVSGLVPPVQYYSVGLSENDMHQMR